LLSWCPISQRGKQLASQEAKLNERADDCVAVARIAMEMAENSAERGKRYRHLKSVLHWLKLATKFRRPRSFQNCDHV